MTADDAGQVLKNWDAIKRETKGGKTQADMLRAVPRALPALMRAGKVQNRARRVGFDWRTCPARCRRSTARPRNSSRRSLPAMPPRWRRSSGTCCFRRSTSPALSTPTRSRRSTGATDKFIRRFTVVEQLAAERGVDMTSASLEQLDRLWEEAKSPSAGIRPARERIQLTHARYYPLVIKF